MDKHSQFEHQRQAMVTSQIAGRGIHDERLLAAYRHIPRHCFVLPEEMDDAYQDCPLPIGCGQTISQPFITAKMTELLQLTGSEVVLEVGTGSGYQAAILSCLAARVHTIEVQPDLASRARHVLADLGLTNVTVHQGDGSLGLPDFAPYQGILVTAAAPMTPRPLLDQLAIHGRLVIPVGNRSVQVLQMMQRTPEGFAQSGLIPVVFVPLRGMNGWSEDEWKS